MKGPEFLKAINTWNIELFKSFQNMKTKFFSENNWGQAKHFKIYFHCFLCEVFSVDILKRLKILPAMLPMASFFSEKKIDFIFRKLLKSSNFHVLIAFQNPGPFKSYKQKCENNSYAYTRYQPKSDASICFYMQIIELGSRPLDFWSFM